jgi:hypothetical protein
VPVPAPVALHERIVDSIRGLLFARDPVILHDVQGPWKLGANGCDRGVVNGLTSPLPLPMCSPVIHCYRAVPDNNPSRASARFQSVYYYCYPSLSPFFSKLVSSLCEGEW